MEMPSGVVWSYYKPCVFHGLYVKDSDSVLVDPSPDFSVSDLIGAVENDSSGDFMEKCERMERGESLPVDFEYSSREGMFDDKQLFAVYEREDVEKLIDRLTKTLKENKI